MGKNIESRYIKVNELNIHILSAEEGSPVFLLHGGGADLASLSWRLSIGPLSQDHRGFAPDFPSYGESGKPRTGYTNQSYVSPYRKSTKTQ